MSLNLYEAFYALRRTFKPLKPTQMLKHISACIVCMVLRIKPETSSIACWADSPPPEPLLQLTQTLSKCIFCI